MRSTNSIINVGIRLMQEVLRATSGSSRQPSRRRREQTSRRQTSQKYPGDFTGNPHISYTPFDDNLADPGEVVWTWVPYEEDFSQGKDRPVLIIGRDGRWLLALQVTSHDHDLDASREARAGRYWEDIGTGGWDSQGRPSEVRLNRIIRIDPHSVRRIGAVLDEGRFNRVAKGVARHS